METRKCSIEGCGDKHEAHGLCKTHYHRSPEVRARHRERNRARRLNPEFRAWEQKKSREYARNRRKNDPEYAQQELFKRRRPDRRFSICRRQAERRDIEFALSLEKYCELIKTPCFYCGQSLEKETGGGLDRIDNSKGYLVDNVLPCCGDCNYIRSDMLTVEETKVAIMAVLEFRAKKLSG